MSLSISEALQQAEEAVNGGDYQSATAICSTLVNQFPGYVAAYRLLGEVYREQGYAQEAESAFTEALIRHPRLSKAYQGLGLIAEDQGSTDSALAFCQVAWELAPDQSHLRESLTRVAMRRYNADGELQLTQAALAQLHASSSRLRRAVSAYRAALAELPGRVDLRVGLAESLWRLGQDTEAATICRSVLEQVPNAVQALVILGDIEKRQGNVRAADDILKRLRAVDPDGAITSNMVATNHRADRQYLELPAGSIPTLSDSIITTIERPNIAPAPDFEYQPISPEIPTPDISLPESFDFAAFDITGDPDGVAAWDAQVEMPDLPAGLQPFSLEEFGATTGDIVGASFSLNNLDFEDFSAQPADPPVGGTVVPFHKRQQPDPTQPAARELQPQQGVSDLDSLAASLQDDVADALARAGEPVEYEGDLQASRPADSTPRGYTTMLQGLNAEGLVPFDPRDAGAATHDAPAAPAAPQPKDSGRNFASDWDAIDEEIQRAVPGVAPHGYTDELRALDEIGLVPFDIEEDNGEIEAVTPFSLDHLSMEPVAVPPVPAPVEPVVDTVIAEAVQETVEADEQDVVIEGLQPFSVDEIGLLEPVDTSTFVTRRQSIWDADGADSVIPSDEDLEALLALDNDAHAAAELPIDLSATMPLVARGSMEDAPQDRVAGGEPAITDGLTIVEEIVPAAREMTLEATPATGTMLSEAELDDLSDWSGAATRILPGGANLSGGEQSEDPEDVRPVADLSIEASPLRPGTEFFTRARAVKLGLVSEGVISGDRELGLVDDADDNLLGGETQGELAEDTVVVAASAASVTRDPETLRSALEMTPEDDELRWWLAEALRERGDIAEALAEYRWLIRNAPSRHDGVLQSLIACVDRGQSPEMAHRLLGDLYRRQGDIARASNHAALALQHRRRASRAS